MHIPYPLMKCVPKLHSTECCHLMRMATIAAMLGTPLWCLLFGGLLECFRNVQFKGAPKTEKAKWARNFIPWFMERKRAGIEPAQATSRLTCRLSICPHTVSPNNMISSGTTCHIRATFRTFYLLLGMWNVKFKSPGSKGPKSAFLTLLYRSVACLPAVH